MFFHLILFTDVANETDGHVVLALVEVSFFGDEE